MTEDEPAVPIVCPECDTETRIALSDVAESLERHNDRLHDGEEVAVVDPDIAEQIANIVAEDLDLV